MISRDEVIVVVSISGAPPARLVRVILSAVGAENTAGVVVGDVVLVGSGVGVGRGAVLE